MRLRNLALWALLALAPAAWAQEQAFTNRSTELKDRGASDAKTLATLPENTSVKVIQRMGGWTRVEANGQAGYVNVFALRFPATVETGTAASGVGASLTNFFGGGRSQTNKASIATTGIRGLSPEDLQNASPNPEALAKAESYRADKPTAERFAKEGKLATVSVDNPSQGGRR
jgi:hypothetical protein